MPLSSLELQAQPEDAAVVYFAGHGTAQQNRFYLLPQVLGYDGPRTKLDQVGSPKTASKRPTANPSVCVTQRPNINYQPPDESQPMATLIKVKQIPGINCDGAIHSGMKLALNTRLEQMCALREAAIDWSDPEGVHKMRVASRRLRGALRDFAPYLGKRRISSFLKIIKEIAQALGRVRDYDVAIMTLERTTAKAPSEIAAGIRRLADFRDVGRRDARAKLTAILIRESLSELTTKFKAALEAHPPRTRATRSPKQNISAATEITYREVARSIILTRLEDLERLSKSLYRPLKIAPLHEMRIAAKHLRYALELFEHCWGTPVAFFAKKVAGLQSSLGKLHDCDVWIEDFGQTVVRDVPDLDFDQRATLVWLLCHFVRLRGENLTEALMQWQEWKVKAFSAGLRESIEGCSSVLKA